MCATCHSLFKFPSIHQIGSVCSGRSQDPWIVDRIKWCITLMHLIISTLSFLYTTLYLIYYTFSHISCSHSFNFIVLITCHLFKSWQECAAHLLLFVPAPGETDDLSTMRIQMTISSWYPTITMIVKMTIQNPTMSLSSNHQGKS